MAVLLILLLSGIVSVSFAEKINNLQSRIINGENATLSEIPFIVSVQHINSNYTINGHFGGGVILNKNYVLTTAFCADNTKISNLRIVAGTTDLKNPQIIRKVIERRLHDYYQPADFGRYDIALLKVDPPFEFTKTVAPCTLSGRDEVFDGKIAKITGWGQIEDNGPISQFLKKTYISIVNNKKCKDIYNDVEFTIYEEHMCGMNKTERHGSCLYDTGGPLIIDGIVAGLFSWRYEKCASLKYPAVYADISKHLWWINMYAK